MLACYVVPSPHGGEVTLLCCSDTERMVMLLAMLSPHGGELTQGDTTMLQ